MPNAVVARSVVDLVREQGGKLCLVLQDGEHPYVHVHLPVRQSESAGMRAPEDVEAVLEIRIRGWWGQL